MKNPNMRRDSWQGGSPGPENDAHRCVFIKRDGTRCKKWAMKGTDRCNSKRHQRRGYQYKVGVKHLPKFYGRVMTQTLRERIDASLSATHDEQIELYEELAIMRESAAEAVRLWSFAMAQLEKARAEGRDASKLVGMVEDAADLMAKHLEHVKEYALAIARVRSMTKDKLTLHTLYGVVHQVTRLMYEVCGEENEVLARELEHRLRVDIVIPTDGREGTTLTPDQTALDMDGTIPEC